MTLKRLKTLRKKCDMSQDDLAKLLGLTQQAIGKWERGKSDPSNADIVRLANLFSVTTDYLLGNSDDSTHIVPFNETILSDSEKRFLSMYRVIPTTDKEMIEAMLELSYNRVEGTNKKTNSGWG